MYTILTLYKANSDIIQELFNGPIEPVMLCFSSNIDVNGKFGGSFLSYLQGLVNRSGDYSEIHMEFINHENYQEWHEIFGHIHDPARASLDQYFKDNGIIFQRYFEFTDLADTIGTKPISDFVPHNELLYPFSNPTEG